MRREQNEDQSEIDPRDAELEELRRQVAELKRFAPPEEPKRVNVEGKYRVVHEIVGSQASIGPFVKGDILSEEHFRNVNRNIPGVAEPVEHDYSGVKARWLQIGAIVPHSVPESQYVDPHMVNDPTDQRVEQ